MISLSVPTAVMPPPVPMLGGIVAVLPGLAAAYSVATACNNSMPSPDPTILRSPARAKDTAIDPRRSADVRTNDFRSMMFPLCVQRIETAQQSNNSVKTGITSLKNC
jgi:hypothetical protein